MYRKILLPLLTGDHQMDAAASSAFQIARRFDAHVEVLYVQPDPLDVIVVMGEGLAGTMWDEALQEARTKVAVATDVARAHFEGLCRNADLPVVASVRDAQRPSASWRTMVGTLRDVLMAEARWADLVVLPMSPQGLKAGWRTVFDTALFASARPVILAPTISAAHIATTVLVAWNGSIQATRAVTAALPLLKRARHVVVAAQSGTVKSGHAQKLEDYLALHEINATVIKEIDQAGDVGEALLELSAQIGADLLVMGGYGHSRFQEWALGGTTRNIIENAALPVLMAH